MKVWFEHSGINACNFGASIVFFFFTGGEKLTSFLFSFNFVPLCLEAFNQNPGILKNTCGSGAISFGSRVQRASVVSQK